MAFDTRNHVYELAPLPFPRDALRGISATTVEYHYDRHHRGYVAKLNAQIADSPLKGQPIDDVVRKAEGALLDNAAQAWNHAFYWNSLTPEQSMSPSRDLTAMIHRDFGSVDRFLERFRASAAAKFGSGWTWLVVDARGRLSIENTADADTPLRHGYVPLLTCDVWEHAYYLDYRNERLRYLDAFLGCLNWEFASHNLSKLPARVLRHQQL
jgi:superoxide dismutase, Fe-Mn family